MCQGTYNCMVSTYTDCHSLSHGTVNVPRIPFRFFLASPSCAECFAWNATLSTGFRRSSCSTAPYCMRAGGRGVVAPSASGRVGERGFTCPVLFNIVVFKMELSSAGGGLDLPCAAMPCRSRPSCTWITQGAVVRVVVSLHTNTPFESKLAHEMCQQDGSCMFVL